MSRWAGVAVCVLVLLAAALRVEAQQGPRVAKGEPYAEPEPAKPSGGRCAPAMALVEGSYCSKVLEPCLAWMEPPGRGDYGRCLRFAPSECVGERTTLRFCIDVDEYPESRTEEDSLPMHTVSWRQAKQLCEAIGKRLCSESEWNLACEGEAMLPYPTGLVRDAAACNFDRMELLDANGDPRDLRMRPSQLRRCVSPFGVRNLVGNIDEWTKRDVTWGPNRGALKGGWWLAGRNRCRPATTAHSEDYRDFQTGFRCCSTPD